jgi:hypothetical protein
MIILPNKSKAYVKNIYSAFYRFFRMHATLQLVQDGKICSNGRIALETAM